MNRLTPVVKNLLIINVVVYFGASLISSNANQYLGLYYFASPNFYPYQFFTYMFAHGGFGHIFFNMLGLFFLGPLLEQFWGPKKFIAFYLVTGLGAGLIYNGIQYFTIKPMERDMISYQYDPTPEKFYGFVTEHFPRQSSQIYQFYENYSEHPNNESIQIESVNYVQQIYRLKLSIPMVGASGAIYGLLMAIALLFPNTQFMLLFPPIPIKAKYLALILGGVSLFSGIQGNVGDNVAHFAHLGGMVFAFILIRIWRKDRGNFY